MPFDINQEIFDEDFDEQKMFAYQQELASLFGQSPEAKAFLEEDEDHSLFWADTLVEFGLTCSRSANRFALLGAFMASGYLLMGEVKWV